MSDNKFQKTTGSIAHSSCNISVLRDTGIYQPPHNPLLDYIKNHQSKQDSITAEVAADTPAVGEPAVIPPTPEKPKPSTWAKFLSDEEGSPHLRSK